MPRSPETKPRGTAEGALFLAEEILRTRTRLRELEAQFNALVAGGRGGGRPRGDAMPDGRALTRRQGRTAPTSRAASSSPADLVKAHFAASVGKKVSIDDLAAAIPGVDPKILRATVARLSRKNKREYRRSARGTYVYKPRPA